MEAWEVRFVEEYNQLKDRLTKLDTIIANYKANTLNFEPKSPLRVLQLQAMYMRGYLDILKQRAELENIDLYEYHSSY